MSTVLSTTPPSTPSIPLLPLPPPIKVEMTAHVACYITACELHITELLLHSALVTVLPSAVVTLGGQLEVEGDLWTHHPPPSLAPVTLDSHSLDYPPPHIDSLSLLQLSNASLTLHLTC